MRLPQIGDLFESKFRLKELIGTGGFAQVFLAEDPTGRPVALKVLLPEAEDYASETVARFKREVTIVGSLRDPHTVTMFESGRSADGLLYVVFEHVPGQDLSELLEQRGRIGPDETIHILRQVLMSLREAHNGGLLHRDIKPENIRVFEYIDDPLRAKLLDFGIAKSPERDGQSSITKTGELVGTPRYMSPEQLMARPLTPASDIYSLGLVMFEMLLGREALGGNSWSDQIGRLQSGYVFNTPELERLGSGLVEVLNRMAAREVDRRYGTADAVLRALDAVASGRAAASQSMERPIVPAPEPSGNGIARVGALILLTLLVAGIVVAAVQVKRQLRARGVAPPPPPVERNLPAGLVKGAAVAETPAIDQGGRDDAQVDAGDMSELKGGCGMKPPFTGYGEGTSYRGLGDTRWVGYIPRRYDPAVEHPVVVVAYPDHIKPDAFMTLTGLDLLADRHGFVMISPDFGEQFVWHGPDNAVGTQDVFEDVARLLCLDRDRVFVMGHNNGGMGVERLSCEPWIAAAAYVSYRPALERWECPTPKPLLLLSPLKTGHAPIDGGFNCYGSAKVSLEAFEARSRARNQCGDEPRSFFSYKGSECQTWACSEAPLVTCRLDGGLGWPGSAPRPLADWANCDGTPADFPHAKMVWSFFDSVTKRDGVPKPPKVR